MRVCPTAPDFLQRSHGVQDHHAGFLRFMLMFPYPDPRSHEVVILT